MSLYFFPFLVSLMLTGVGIYVFLFFGKKYGAGTVDRGEEGRDGTKNISRLGGAIAGGVFLTALFLDPALYITPDVWGLIAGCAGMLLLGIRDDAKALGWKWQLLSQGVIVFLIIFFFGVHISDVPNMLGGRIFFEGPWGLLLGSALAGIWFLLIINALNWSDGIDGVAPGTVVLASLALFAVSLRPEVYQPPTAIMALALAGSYLGLFLFNIHPARIFSGTAGVFMAGFAIAYLSIFAGMKIATAFLVLGIPILDALWVMLQRYRSGSALTHPDKRHLHFALLASGWSERRTSFFLLGTIALATGATLVFGTLGKVVAVLALIGVFLILALKLKKRNASIY